METENESEARIAALEERVSALEDLVQPASDHLVPAGEDAPTGERLGPGSRSAAGSTDPFWALNGLKEQCGEAGGVVYAGCVRGPGDRTLDWQYGRPGDYLEARDFAASAGALSALASPVRLSLLQAVYNGAHSVTELAATGEFGTTGQIYHHVNQLAAAGWLESPRRGHWLVPAERIVPLLTIILVTQG